MPRARREIAELFILHLVELGKELGNQPVWTAMIGEEVVADAMPR